MHPVRVGTCGWSYKEWAGVFYPDGLAPGDFLGYYAERYPVVEVDSTFYRRPARKTVEGWRDHTPTGQPSRVAVEVRPARLSLPTRSLLRPP